MIDGAIIAPNKALPLTGGWPMLDFINIFLVIAYAGASGPLPVPVEAEVVRYISDAMHDDYEDGRWETFDAVEFKITAPRRWRGKKLLVYCESGKGSFAPAGAKCRFKIEEKYVVGTTRDPATGKVTTYIPFRAGLEDFQEVE